VVGDRGPSSLDWAISDGEGTWGVTVLQAVAEMDAGPVWASETFSMRQATKSSLYRQEVTEAAVRSPWCGPCSTSSGTVPGPPTPPVPDPRGRWRPLMRQPDRRIDWTRDDTATVLRKAHAADGTPGVLDELFGVPCHLFDLHAAGVAARRLAAGLTPGTLVARRHEAVLRATRDGGGVDRPRAPRRRPGRAEAAGGTGLCRRLRGAAPWTAADEALAPGWRDLWTEVDGDVVSVHFPFHNGAMSTPQCGRLIAAVQDALAGPQKVLLLCGGSDFWSNGIHLNVIEAASSPAEASWANINAIDDLTRNC
jgi:putative two-component system hydrogenase maturation factor HypX/HoxX